MSDIHALVKALSEAIDDLEEESYLDGTMDSRVSLPCAQARKKINSLVGALRDAALFADAVAAVDATLHHAIDHWQSRALAAEAELAAQQPLTEERDALRRALEVIAVGDSKNPVIDAGEALVALGFWQAEQQGKQP